MIPTQNAIVIHPPTLLFIPPPTKIPKHNNHNHLPTKTLPKPKRINNHQSPSFTTTTATTTQQLPLSLSSEFDKDYSQHQGDDNDDYAARSPFGTKSYWDAMYQGMGDFSSDEYSWYYGYEGIKPHISQYLPTDKQERAGVSVLIPGCGNDPLLLDLYNEGYRSLVAFDYSQGAIDRQLSLLEYLPMAGRGGKDDPLENVKLTVQDARSLPSEWEGSFDVIIEKGALDAIYLSGDGNFESSVREFKRVIRTGGVCVSVSGVVPEELRREWFGEEEWEWLRDGSEDLKAGCFVWRKR